MAFPGKWQFFNSAPSNSDGEKSKSRLDISPVSTTKKDDRAFSLGCYPKTDHEIILHHHSSSLMGSFSHLFSN